MVLSIKWDWLSLSPAKYGYFVAVVITASFTVPFTIAIVSGIVQIQRRLKRSQKDGSDKILIKA